MQRWNSRYRFAWTPIITFGTRRLAFLEWVEANLDPIAFTETPERVGVAFGDPRIRLTISAGGMTLEDGAADPEWVRQLEEALVGVFVVMQPRDVVLTSAAVAWSQALDGVSYDAATAEFARCVSGIGPGSSYVASDASALMDATIDGANLQIEWGVVKASELLERVASPDIGRIGGGRAATSLSQADIAVAPVSVFFDSLVHRYSVPRDITDAASIIETLAHADALSEGLASELARSWQTKGEVQG